MKFAKMQGTGNDFLLGETSDEGRDWGALAQAMCERHYGVGADGLMLVMPSEKADVRMRLFNADGSEAEGSGNGVRCLVKYVIEGGLAPPRSPRGGAPVLGGAAPRLIDMPREVDGQTLAVTCLSMGNPHAVLFVDSPVAEYPLDDLGPKVERHPAFPARRGPWRGTAGERST